MSLTEHPSPAFDAGSPLGADGRRLAEPSAWSYLRSLSAGPATAPEWADDERLDELFSAWAEAALEADVVTDRRLVPAGDAAPAPEPAPDGTVYEPSAGGADLDPLAAREALPVWSRSDDEVIPRRRGRWGRRRR